MGDTQVYAALTGLFRDIFDEDDLDLTAATTAAEVDGWDSLSHIRLILAIEQGFKIRFSAAQVGSFANVGELVGMIVSKTGAGVERSAAPRERVA